jgi:hypothetical protein
MPIPALRFYRSAAKCRISPFFFIAPTHRPMGRGDPMSKEKREGILLESGTK